MKYWRDAPGSRELGLQGMARSQEEAGGPLLQVSEGALPTPRLQTPGL